MIITKPGKYILTENYDKWRGPWEIATIQAGTVIEVDGIGVQYHDGEIHSNVLGWTSHDLPIEPVGE